MQNSEDQTRRKFLLPTDAFIFTLAWGWIWNYLQYNIWKWPTRCNCV